jgi:hypothetical protein
VNSTVSNNTAQGGMAASGGSPGTAIAGGIDAPPAGTSLTLASVTLTGNGSLGTNMFAGNLYDGVPITFRDTLISSGTGATVHSNCSVPGGGVTDAGHNLEGTTPSQCGFSAAHADLIGVDPLLSPLAFNGGPTQTEALPASSPARGAGGMCVDPSQAGSPALTVDERGLPRPNPCDIGAFQAEPPVNQTAPAINGAVQAGQSISCAHGGWLGDFLTFAYQWLSNGAPIAGATGPTYVVQPSDVGRALSCRVTATGPYGQASAASAAVTATAAPNPSPSPASVPTLSGLSESATRWVLGSALPRISRKRKLPVGTTFSFALNTPATVRFDFTQAAAGRKLGRRCVKRSKANARKPTCAIVVTVGTFSFAGHAGTNKVAFQGRLPSSKKLKPGVYTLKITAKNAAGQSSTPAKLSFTIVKG